MESRWRSASSMTPMAAIVEFKLGALLENPHRLGGELQRELSGMRSARRGVYRIIDEIDDVEHLVIVDRIEHRATAYRPRGHRVDRQPWPRSPSKESGDRSRERGSERPVQSSR
jgi:mRNA-degrading endonuclease RelE of RelBE toxin-antitoxin system